MFICLFEAIEALHSQSWIGGLKRAMCVALKWPRLWQPGFFDHTLRSDESYAAKWNYVRNNPVRAGLVRTAHECPSQGAIIAMDCPGLAWPAPTATSRPRRRLRR